MITIKTIDKNNAELHIKEGTPHITMLLGIEMLIETLLQESSLDLTIDMLLQDLKKIYNRDNKGVKNNENEEDK